MEKELGLGTLSKRSRLLQKVAPNTRGGLRHLKLRWERCTFVIWINKYSLSYLEMHLIANLCNLRAVKWIAGLDEIPAALPPFACDQGARFDAIHQVKSRNSMIACATL